CCRRANSTFTCSASSDRPAGMPSRMLTSAGPCDSPAVVKRSIVAGGRWQVAGQQRRAGELRSPAPHYLPATSHRQPATTKQPSRCRFYVGGSEVDDDQTLLREPEQLEYRASGVAGEGTARAQRTVEIPLDRELAAREEVRDVHDLDVATLRSDEGKPVAVDRGITIGAWMEGDAGTIVE